MKKLLIPAVSLPFASVLPAADASPWELTGAAGLAISDGNSDSVAYSLQFLASYLNDGHEAYLGLDYFYAEDGGLESTDSLKVFGQYNRDLSERWFIGGFGSYFQDNIAGIDYRVDTSLLLGYRAIKGERMALTFEAGPGYAWEKQGRTTDDFVTLRLAQRFDYRFSETSKFWQALGWTPRADDLSDSLVEFEAGLETRITSKVSLRTFLRHRIDDTPAAGSGKTDTALLVGVAYDFSGLPDPKEDGGSRRSLMPGEEAAAAKRNGWASTAALGFSLNKGNSDKMGLNLAWNTLYRDAEREFFLDLGYHYSEDNGLSSTDRLLSRVQYNRYLGERFYLGGAVGFLRDDPADIDYRVTPAFLAGYSLIKSDKTQLAFEAGPAYTFEKTGGISDDYASLVAAQRFSHQFNGTVSFKQSVSYTAELGDLENYTAIAAAALDTKLNDRLIWRLGADYSYENIPAAGRQHHDTQLTSSIAVKF
ncbi:DUF481 domain-containing protein [Luteolibacter marinus]|uniref:DUF481 domain-containing protein n=1 Tax=Luteolibacter marinus TaxID=2776705 RepID=UPI001D027068|nr:DUF481 domain-containing protein [Luteolibacter marinus]